MSLDIRWHQRFENLTKALHRLREALDATAKEPNNHLYQIALVVAFQFTFELCWKTLKDYLVYSGVEVSLPRDVIKQAFQHQIIQDGQVWIQMLENRHMIKCVYEQQAALAAGKTIRECNAPAIEQTHRDLIKKRTE
jgi:nucleotidyltransferase substrate binding protein (TIGR01987 family)